VKKISSRFTNLVLFIALSASSVCVLAQQDPKASDANTGKAEARVTISALRDPVDKSYRDMIKGMDVFEKFKHLSPNGVLRFKFVRRQKDTVMEDIVLKVVGESKVTRVPVASDHTFVLERDQTAYEEDASVRPNRKEGSLTWRADIRTPGLPLNTRRLGDLRLECRVGIAAGLRSEGYPFMRMMRTITAPMRAALPSVCERLSNHYPFFSETPLFSVTLKDGARQQVLSINWLYSIVKFDHDVIDNRGYYDEGIRLDHTYTVPLDDLSWSDDTLVEIEEMDTPPSKARQSSTIPEGASQ
jgi:hypothetical protein